MPRIRNVDKLGVRRDKWNNILCPHNKIRCVCKACGGASICEHGRQRSYCKPCGGPSICLHGRQRPSCKECGGSGICPHQRRRSTCKDCCPFGAYKKIRCEAKIRGHLFEISFEEYQTLVSQVCAYCGSYEEKNGIDQVVAGAGYTSANCVPCCSACNDMKNDRTVEAFLRHVLRISTFQTSGKKR